MFAVDNLISRIIRSSHINMVVMRSRFYFYIFLQYPFVYGVFHSVNVAAKDKECSPLIGNIISRPVGRSVAC